MATAALFAGRHLHAQCFGVRGPNLMAAKGTFSKPFITANPAASACSGSGANSYSPAGNVGNAISTCSSPGNILPCSDYTYTATSMSPEGRYTLIKVIGNTSGGNCIKADWRGSDHTGDGGYFMLINGAPNTNTSPIFYQVKSIPVCVGTTYEVSAWVINVLPSTSGSAGANTEPNITLKINDQVVANSGRLAYQPVPAWVKISGFFTATTDTVQMQVLNATSVASGNDLGIDDLSIRACGSLVATSGPETVCSGNPAIATYTITDPASENSWYKWQLSQDGALNFTDLTTGAQATFVNNSYSVDYNIPSTTLDMNGNVYRLIIASSQAGLETATCGRYNDFVLTVANCGTTPVKFNTFNGRYANGTAYLDWQTSEEINTARFEIQRSYDGNNFTSLATVRSAGNSSTLRYYNYQDNNAGNGKYVYYRIRQVDLDGRYSHSNIVRLSLGERTGMDIYPNPFASQFTVAFSAPAAENATLVIRNNTGQVVHSRMVKVTRGNNSISLEQLPALQSGQYYVQLHGDRIHYNAKIQKH